MSRLVLKLAAPARAYNIVGQRYGIPRFTNFIDLIEGDHTLLADVPEWVGFPKIRPSLHYVGPLPARINRPVPEEVAAIPRDKPVVYFAMGSSGKPKLICDIIKGFKDRPYRVIAPVKRLVQNMNVEVPPNLVLTGFLPAHKVNPMADVSVIHGGQNTVMNACRSGTPIVGVGMHPEQSEAWDHTKQTVVIAEGLVMYLSPQAVRDLFCRCNSVTGAGSRVAFSYIPTGKDGWPDAGRRTGLMLWILKAQGEPWLWSVRPDELGGFLADTGWTDAPDLAGTTEKHGVEYFAVARK